MSQQSEFVTCPHCGQSFKSITSRHKSVCEGWPKGPEVPPCLCGHISTSLTQMKRHRVDCAAWKGRNSKEVRGARRKQTTMERYGVEHVAQVAEIQAKMAATNLERYGSTSVVSRDSLIFDKVQASLRGKRFRFTKGALDNPFAHPEVQARARETRLERYGVEHPGQIPEGKERARQTSLEKYGTENPMQSAEVQARARQTNLGRYGHENPGASSEVKEQIAATNLERYGVRSTAAIPEFRRKQLETMEANWGGHFFASSVGKGKIRASMRAKHGVDHPAQVEGFWKRQVERFLAKYGVAHPLQLAEFLEKRAATCQRLYGVDSPLQSPEIMARVVATCQDRYHVNHAVAAPEVRAKIVATMMSRFGVESALSAISVQEKGLRTSLAKVGKTFGELVTPATTREDLIERYGVAHPLQDREYAAHHLEQMGTAYLRGPNGFEGKLLKLCWGLLHYTGDRKFWRWLPALKHHKNPDFVIPGPDPKNPLRGVTRVVEAHGDYWHSEKFTGMANEEHERLLVDAYREVGLECLVVWEGDLLRDPEGVRRRVEGFVSASV